MAWPVADQAELTLDLAQCKLFLPIRNSDSDDQIEKAFAAPVAAEPLAHKIVEPSKGGRSINNNVETGETVYDVHFDGGKIYFESTDLIYGSSNTQRYTITEGDPLSAGIYYQAEFSFAREEWDVQTSSELTVTCDADNFYLKGKIEAFEDEQLVFNRGWDLSIPRTVF